MNQRNPFANFPSTDSTILEVPPRVLVVDDSAPSRAALAEVLEDAGCVVVGRAMDGAMALRMVVEQNPDVITCDLEMPRMDGFTFLRVLAQTRATPVIVVTSDARPEAALLALELGARDFVVKPSRLGDFAALQGQLKSRVRALTAHQKKTPAWSPGPDVPVPQAVSLVVIGASTGGPRALRDLLQGLRPPLKAPVLIVQHMPARFTAAFAERLQRFTGLDVREAKDGEVVSAGMIRVAAGGKHLRVTCETRSRDNNPETFRLHVTDAQPGDRYVPSIDVALASALSAANNRTLVLILTGMGRDGCDAARAIRAVGAPLWTESASTAAIDGMPTAVALAHGDAPRVPLDELATLLARALSAS